VGETEGRARELPGPHPSYIAELNKPRIRLPSLVDFVGAVGVGVVVGRVTW